MAGWEAVAEPPNRGQEGHGEWQGAAEGQEAMVQQEAEDKRGTVRGGGATKGRQEATTNQRTREARQEAGVNSGRDTGRQKVAGQWEAAAGQAIRLVCFLLSDYTSNNPSVSNSFFIYYFAYGSAFNCKNWINWMFLLLFMRVRLGKTRAKWFDPPPAHPWPAWL